MMDFFEELNNLVEVENAIGSSEAWPKPDDYGCWLDCWEALKKEKAKKCFKCNSTDDLVGAHIVISDEMNGDKTRVYLTILCKPCNNSNNQFTLNKNELVDVSDMCPFRDIIKNYK